MRANILILGIFVLIVRAQPEGEQAKVEEADISMKRTACLVVSRYYSNTQKDAIESIFNELEPDDQRKYIDKMYALAIEHCLPKITTDETTKFFSNDPDFTPADLYYIFDNFEFVSVNNLDSLTKNQESLVKFMKKFDEEMEVKREERDAQQEAAQAEQKLEMKMFGISASDVPSLAMVGYVVIFVAVIGFALYYMFSKVENTKKVKSSNKRRKSPKNA